MPEYLCSLPNPGGAGNVRELISDDTKAITAFIRRENRLGRGVYQCPNPLLPGARRRALETVSEIRVLHADLDLKDVADPPEAVDRKLAELPAPPSEIRDSGHGRHAYYELKEPIPRGDPEFARACVLLRRLAATLSADPAPAHPAALMRVAGTTNSKNGAAAECRTVVTTGARYDLDDIAAMCDLLGEGAYIPRKPRVAKAGDADSTATRTPVDVEAALAAMCWRGAGGTSVNDTHKRVIPSLLRQGLHPADVVERVTEATMEMAARAGLKWKLEVETATVRSRVLSALNNLLLKDYDPATGEIPPWLAGDFHQQWIRTVAAGRTPCFAYNLGGFHVRARQVTEKEGKPQERSAGTGGAKGAASSAGKTTSADPDSPPGWSLYDLTKAAPPRWLIKGLLPESGVAIIPGQWGSYKTTTALEMAVSAMTGQPFAGHYRIKRIGAVVYFAVEGAGTLQSRLTAIARHRDAPAKLPFAWRSDCPRLTAKDAGALIAAQCDEAAAYFERVYAVPTVLILIDTYAAAAGFTTAGDDNDAAATQTAFAALRHVHKHTGAAVVVVDHFGKVIEAGTRGSSNKEANADAVLATLADKDPNGSVSATRLAVRKQRDGRSGFEVPFQPRVIDLGLDEDGDPVTAVVLDWGEPQASPPPVKRSESLTVLCQALKDVVADSGFAYQPHPDGPTVTACDEIELRDEFYKQWTARSGAELKRGSVWSAYDRARQSAKDSKLVDAKTDRGRTVVWPVRAD